MTLSAAAREYLLAFADDEHLVGARHTAWIGLGPFLEEDLAFCSIAQDELGHAIGLYEILLDAEPGATSGLDEFALLRAPAEYRSCWLAEAECAAWSDALVRHWLYDRAEALRWDVLSRCADDRVRDLSARAQREEAFHREHAEQFMARLAATEHVAVLIESVEALLPLGAGLWDAVAGEAGAIEEGFVDVPSATLGQRWQEIVREDLDRWDMTVRWPSDAAVDAAVGGQRGRTARSAVFDALHADLQRVVTIDREAVW